MISLRAASAVPCVPLIHFYAAICPLWACTPKRFSPTGTSSSQIQAAEKTELPAWRDSVPQSSMIMICCINMKAYVFLLYSLIVCNRNTRFKYWQLRNITTIIGKRKISFSTEYIVCADIRLLRVRRIHVFRADILVPSPAPRKFCYDIIPELPRHTCH